MAKSTSESAPDPDLKTIYADMARLALDTLVDCMSREQPSLLVTQEYVPALLAMSERRFYRLKSEGLLPTPVELGEGETLYRRADLIEWVKKLRTQKP